MKEIKSTCIFCGIGCRLRYFTENGKIVKVLPDPEDIDVSMGAPCIKGLSLATIDDKSRILKPMVKKNGRFIEISWEEALKILAEKLRRVEPQRAAFYLSALTTNEVIYAFLKIAEHLGICSIDHCARLCHAATVEAMKRSFGSGAMPVDIKDIEEADVILAFGTDTASDYPALFNRIVRAKKKKNLKLYCIEDAFSHTMKLADKVFPIKPAAHAAFALGLLKALKTGDSAFDEYLESISWKAVEDATGAGKETFEKLAEELKGKKVAILFGMTVTQSGFGTEAVIALANLCIALDGLFMPMRGKINVQGAGDLGAVPRGEGAPAVFFFYSKDYDLYLIHDSNPVKSFPMAEEVRKNLERAFTVYIGPYMNETAEVAKLVIPGTLLIEEEGTVITAERRLRKVNRVRRAPTGIDLYTFAVKLAKLLGLSLPEEPREMLKIIRKEKAFLRATPIEAVATKGIKWKRLIPVPLRIKKLERAPGSFILTTRRDPFHFTTAEVTAHVKALKEKAPRGYVLMNPEDAAKLKVKEGDKVKIATRLGSISAVVKTNPTVARGFIVVPFHYSDLPINRILPLELDPISFEPNLRYHLVKVYKATGG